MSNSPTNQQTWGRSVRFDPAAGGKRWRRAVEAFERAQREMLTTDPLFDPTGKVVSLAVARDSSGGLQAEIARRSEALRAAASALLHTEAPCPREVANKLLLIAWLAGTPDPRQLSADRPDTGGHLAHLFVELHCLDQFHDPRRFKRRKGANA